jgi:hypothetical protein
MIASVDPGKPTACWWARVVPPLWQYLDAVVRGRHTGKARGQFELPDLAVRVRDINVSCPGGPGSCLTTVTYTVSNIGRARSPGSSRSRCGQTLRSESLTHEQADDSRPATRTPYGRQLARTATASTPIARSRSRSTRTTLCSSRTTRTTGRLKRPRVERATSLPASRPGRGAGGEDYGPVVAVRARCQQKATRHLSPWRSPKALIRDPAVLPAKGALLRADGGDHDADHEAHPSTSLEWWAMVMVRCGSTWAIGRKRGSTSPRRATAPSQRPEGRQGPPPGAWND